MQRVFKGFTLLLGSLVLLAALSLGGWHLLDGTPEVAEAVASQNSFNAERLLILADADMAATAYADGVLYPIEDATDQLLSLSDFGNGLEASLSVSNTVMGWPGSMVANETYAYVVTSRGQIDRSVQALPEGVNAEMPTGDLLTTVDLTNGEVISETEVCLKPLSVDLAASGNWLLVACGDAGNELAVVALDSGLPAEIRRFDLDVPSYSAREGSAGATYAVIHPGGTAAGVVLEDQAVTLVELEPDASGIPASVSAEEPQLFQDRWLSVARWTQSGNHLLLADVNWGPTPIDALLNRAGSIISLALSPAEEIRGLVSEAKVSKSPEAFEMNWDGDLLAVVNMERSYLPGGFPTGLAPGRGASSLSLVGVDDATGELTTFGEPIGFRGVLPEDAAFDADGDKIAVVIYQDHDAPRSEGWLSFFEVEHSTGEPRLRLTDERVELPRGAHDLFVIYE